MLKRIVKWLRYYWPSLLLLAEMALAYWLILYFLFQVAWPLWYSNGEPLSLTLDSTQLMRSQEKLAYIQNCYNTYVLMGVFALGLYGVYALSGLLPMPYQTHVEFGKDCRSAFATAFFATMLAVWSNLFAIRGNPNISGTILNGLTAFACVKCLYVAIVKMGGLYNRNSLQTKLKGFAISFGILVVPIMFFWFLQGLDNVWAFVLKVVSWLTKSKAPLATAVPGHFMLSTPIDFLLPAVLLMLFGFLYFAMKYAGPIACSTPQGGHAYTQTSDNVRFPQEVAR